MPALHIVDYCMGLLLLDGAGIYLDISVLVTWVDF
jgi:hypothetical protein